MSFSHRFGVGVGGSPEDPYQPPFCDECQKPYCSGECLQLRRFWEERDKAIQELEEKMQPFKEVEE